MKGSSFSKIVSFLALITIALLMPLSSCIGQTWLDRDDGSFGLFNDDPSYNVRHSDHYRIRWGKQNVTAHTVDEEFVRLNLQNAEKCWHILHDPIVSGGLGFPSPSVLWSGNDGNNYRTNWKIGQTWNDPTGGGAGGGADGEGIATFGMGPWAMAPGAPTTVPYHEYGHGVLIAMKGLNNTSYDSMWHEEWANFASEQITNDLNPASMLINHSFFLPHGRDYYDTWLFFEHVRETPAYGPAFLSTLFQQCQGSSGEYIFDAMTRLDTSGATDHQNAIKDLVGSYAAKNIAWDYQRGDLMRTLFLPNVTDTLTFTDPAYWIVGPPIVKLH